MHPETPIDHPSLEKYPDSPTIKMLVDGVLYRVPIERDNDEAVPVPILDIVHATAVIHQLRQMLEGGAGDDYRVEDIGSMLVLCTEEKAPSTREEVTRELKRLWDRLHRCLPDW